MPLIELPNGLAIRAANRREALGLYHEIVATNSYLQHGIEVHDGSCVFDVGAHVGLFSVHLLSRYQRLQLYAFEPIPWSFNMLQENTRRVAGESRVTVCNIGLADQDGEAFFQFHSSMTALATMRADDVRAAMRRGAGVAAWAGAAVACLEQLSMVPHRAARVAQRALEVPVLRLPVLGLFRVGFWCFERRARARCRPVRCRLRTASQVIREHAIEAIDLMKIDTEGSELDVLAGVEEQDWPKIRSLVVEVHDVDGRLNRVEGLLRSRGYQTVVAPNEFQLQALWGTAVVYATRRLCASGEQPRA